MIEELLLEQGQRKKDPSVINELGSMSESYSAEVGQKGMEAGKSGHQQSIQPGRRRSSVAAKESASFAQGDPHASDRTVEAGQGSLKLEVNFMATTAHGVEPNGGKSEKCAETNDTALSDPDVDLAEETAAPDSLSPWQRRLTILRQMFPPDRSLCCLAPDSKMRRACGAVLAFPAAWSESRRFFDNIILVCIILSSVALAFENPRIGSTRSLPLHQQRTGDALVFEIKSVFLRLQSVTIVNQICST